jgi:hypothetical protein
MSLPTYDNFNGGGFAIVGTHFPVPDDFGHPAKNTNDTKRQMVENVFMLRTSII